MESHTTRIFEAPAQVAFGEFSYLNKCTIKPAECVCVCFGSINLRSASYVMQVSKIVGQIQFLDIFIS